MSITTRLLMLFLDLWSALSPLELKRPVHSQQCEPAEPLAKHPRVDQNLICVLRRKMTDRWHFFYFAWSFVPMCFLVPIRCDVHLSWKWQECRHNTKYAHTESRQNSAFAFNCQSCGEKKTFFFLINDAWIKENIFCPCSLGLISTYKLDSVTSKVPISM
jgi:hypothetical protein